MNAATKHFHLVRKNARKKRTKYFEIDFRKKNCRWRKCNYLVYRNCLTSWCMHYYLFWYWFLPPPSSSSSSLSSAETTKTTPIVTSTSTTRFPCSVPIFYCRKTETVWRNIYSDFSLNTRPEARPNRQIMENGRTVIGGNGCFPSIPAPEVHMRQKSWEKEPEIFAWPCSVPEKSGMKLSGKWCNGVAVSWLMMFW